MSDYSASPPESGGSDSTPPDSAGFNFDHWCKLAADDPQAFFAAREQAIEACIASNPRPEGRQQMRQLQEQVDGLRVIAGAPDRALQGIATLLGDHLHALAANLTELGGEALRLSGLLGKQAR
jgi:hypothetical protein